MPFETGSTPFGSTDTSGIAGVAGPDHPGFIRGGVSGTTPAPVGVAGTGPIPPWVTPLETAARRAGAVVFFTRLDELLAGRLKEAAQRVNEEELNALQEAVWLSKRLQAI